MKLKTIKLFMAVLCVLLFGVSNAMAGTLKVAAGTATGESTYTDYTTNVSDIPLPNQSTINGKSVGTLSYNSSEHKLTLNNVHRTSSTSCQSFFFSNVVDGPLTVELIGDNELEVEHFYGGNAEFFYMNIKVVGSGSLKLNLKSRSQSSGFGAAHGIDMMGTGVVEIALHASTYVNETGLHYSWTATNVNLQEGMMLSKSAFLPGTSTTDTYFMNSVFREGDGLTYSVSKHEDARYAYPIWLRIEPLKKYNLYIAGQQVNWINMKDVLGDGRVSYDPTNNQVRLSNADIHHEYNGSGYQSDNIFTYLSYGNNLEHLIGIEPSTFKVELKDDNKITGVVNDAVPTYYSFHGFKMPNCTFVGDGTLRMELSANKAAAQGIYGFSPLNSNYSNSVNLDPSFKGWVSVSVSNVGSNPAAAFEKANCQLSLPNTTDYFVAKGSTLPALAQTPATTNTNLNVAHVNFGKKNGSALATGSITNQNLLTGTAYVGKKLADETCGLSVTGGQAPFYYTATNLQDGLGINHESGYVSGTYTTITYGMDQNTQTTLTATDIQGRQTSVSVKQQTVVSKLTIKGHPDSEILTLEPEWAEGVAIEQIKLSDKISGGKAPYTYYALSATLNQGRTTLPTGVSFDKSTGVISGTPTERMEYNYGIVVEDALKQAVLFNVQGNVAENYGFMVAGVPVTGLNKDNIPVSGKTSGTLSYDPATETLFFDNVRAYTTSASTPYFVDSKISKINVVGDNRISYLGSSISGVNEYYGFPGDLDIYGDGQFNFASGRNGPDSYAVNGNVTVKDNATILLFSYYAAVNGTLTVPMNQVLYTAGRSEGSAGEWTMLNGVTENVSNYTNKYVKTEILANGALCFSDKKEGKTIYNTVPVKPFTMFDVKGGVAPYSYSATSLPSGLVIDAKTGYISGTSKYNNSNTTVTFTVTDAMGRDVCTDMELAVKNPTLNLTICGGPNEKSAKLYNWAIAQNLSLEDGQLCLVESDFDFEETLISIPKNKVFLDAKGNTYAKNITLTDGVKYAFPYEVEAQSISYTRSFSDKVAGKWQCLYVPFDITVTEELLKDFEFAKLYMISYKDANNNGEIEDGEPLVMLLMKQAEGKVLHANTPYFIKAKTAGTKSIQVESATLKPVENGTVYCCTTEHEYTLTGIYNTFNINGNYTMGVSGGFSYYDTDTNLKPNRWYMNINSLTGKDDENAAKARQIILMVDGEDDTTGIMDITSGSKNSTAEGVFSLDGRKINETENLSRGIYIKNGKKIMFK